MKTLLYIFSFFIISSHLLSHQISQEIDSLVSHVDKINGKDKVQLYEKIVLKLKAIEPVEGIKIGKMGLNYAYSINDSLGLVDIYNALGLTYKSLNDQDNALDCYYKAMILSESIGDKDKIARAYNNISTIYRNMKFYDKAIDYLNKAIEINKSIDDRKSLATSYMNIGVNYKKKKDYEKALKYYNLAMSLENYKAANFKGKLYNNIAVVYLRINEPEKAREYISKSLKIKEKANDAASLAIGYNNLSKILYSEDLFYESLKYAEESLKLAEEKDLTAQKMISYKYLSMNYGKLKDFEKAYNYNLAFINLKDSINNSSLKDKILQNEIDFALEEKENELQKLEIHNAQLSRNHLILLIIIIILTILGVILIIRNYYKNKNSRLLEKVNKEINEANLQLKESEIKLKELNQTKDKFFSIISHDLKNPLGSFTGMTEILINNSLTEKENNQIINDLNKQAKNLYNLLDNLLEWSRIQIKNIYINPVKVDLNFIVKNNLESLRLLARQKGITIEDHIEETVYVNIDVNMITTVIRNIISNAIKFSFPDSTIKIFINETDINTELVIQDYGIGIPKEKLAKLFTIEGAYSSAGTLNEKGTGLGLLLSKEFIELNKGKIEVVSDPEKGSSFIIIFPKPEKQKVSSPQENLLL